MRGGALVVVLACALAFTPRALADSDPVTNAFRAIGEGLRGENVPTSGVLPVIGAGWAAVDGVAIAGELGWMWGIRNTGLFGNTTVTHVTFAPTISASVGDVDDVTVDLAVLGGYTSFGLGTVGGAIGVDVRVTDGVAVGPLGKLRLGIGNLCLFLLGGPRFEAHATDTLFVLGLELN